MMLVAIPFGGLRAQGNWSPPERVVLAKDTGVFFTRDSEGVLIEKALDRVILQRLVTDMQIQIEFKDSQVRALLDASRLKEKQISILESDLNKLRQQRDYFERQAQDELQDKIKIKTRSKRSKFLMIGLGLVGGYFVGKELN